MGKWLKWIAVSMGVGILLLILIVLIAILVITNPKVEPIPSAYQEAEQLWFYDGTEETANAFIELKINDVIAIIGVTHVPVVGTQIQYADEKNERMIFPTELYYGATEVRYAADTGIVYVKVLGSHPMFSLHGTRIFEFDVQARECLRNYWIEVD